MERRVRNGLAESKTDAKDVIGTIKKIGRNASAFLAGISDGFLPARYKLLVYKNVVILVIFSSYTIMVSTRCASSPYIVWFLA